MLVSVRFSSAHTEAHAQIQRKRRIHTGNRLNDGSGDIRSVYAREKSAQKRRTYAMFGISKAFINNKTKRPTRNEKWPSKAILFPDIRNALSKISYSPTSTKEKKKHFFCLCLCLDPFHKFNFLMDTSTLVPPKVVCCQRTFS